MCLPLPRFILKESGLARYLHSAVLISGVLLVFGGNTHNDTSLSNGAKCFSSDFLSYDIGMNHLWPPFSVYTSTSLKVKCRITIIVILPKFRVVIFVKIIIVPLFGNFCTSHLMKLYNIHNYHTLNSFTIHTMIYDSSVWMDPVTYYEKQNACTLSGTVTVNFSFKLLQCDITDSSLQKANKPVEIYWNAQLSHNGISQNIADIRHIQDAVTACVVSVMRSLVVPSWKTSQCRTFK